MKFQIIYGTESGNAETVADDLVDEFDGDVEIEATDMTDVTLEELDPSTFLLVICSTHGDGGMPASAVPFAQLLDDEQPDLTGLRYAVFGLGDSSYETYSRGSEHIDVRLQNLGATRVGDYGRHDAADGSLPNESALEWAHEIIAAVAVEVPAR